jgi:hypothetical protein
VARRNNGTTDVAVRTLEEADALWPLFASDADVPPTALKTLTEQIERTSDALKIDHSKRFEPMLSALEKAGRSKTLVQTARGLFLTHHAWEARGGGYASSVTEAGWRGVH